MINKFKIIAGYKLQYNPRSTADLQQQKYVGCLEADAAQTPGDDCRIG